MKSGRRAAMATVVRLGVMAGLLGCAESGVPFDDDDGGVGDGGDGGELGVEDAADGEGDSPGDAAAEDAGEESDTGPGVPGLECEACTEDSDCSAGYPCVALPSGGSVCLRSCDAEIPECPPRFDCVESRITPLPEPVCAPVGERCCVDGDADDYGTGVGCRGPDCDDADPGIHVGAAEACDGVDNNCDGSVDDGDPGGGLVCLTGLPGVCSSGVTVCQDAAVVCRPAVEGATEVCDGTDNDCNGWVDEDDSLRALTRPCYDGPPGTADVGVCVAGVQTCAGGEFRSCVGQVLPAAERCDGVDENCDDVIDDGDPGGGIACMAPVPGICAAGATACVSGAVTCISTILPGSRPEICDALDNDCDGVLDDGFVGLGTACSAGLGVCRRAGVRVCNPSDTLGPPICDAVPGVPAAIERCDYEDDDCDGATDEGYLLGRVCTAGIGACLRSGVTECDAAGTATRCNAVPGTPSIEACDYVDNDCNGTTDDGFAFAGDPLNPGTSYPLGDACAIGLGACRRGGVVVCSGGAATCSAPVVPPGAETCNYVDDDCDGTVDDGFVNGAGVYSGDRDCGACGIDCTVIYALPGAFGTCSVAGSSATCMFNCNAGFFNLNGIPGDGCEFSLDPGAIYVSGEDPASVDDATCGLGPASTGGGRHACRTIAFGISRATALGRSRVLVADALYSESVALVAGVGLLGGYRADTWERHLTTTLTTIRAPTGAGHRRTITASGIAVATRVEGFVVDGTTATTAGANSYAIYVSGGTSALTFASNTIYVGDGAPGANGGAGGDGANGFPGAAGLNAIDTGSTACGISRGGGAGGARLCGATTVNGGAGGSAVCPVFWGATPGSSRAGGAGSGGGGGAGGAVAYDGQTRPAESCLTCYLPSGGQTMTGGNGTAGANGPNGGGGAGAASAVGSVVANEWIGAAGTAGGGGNNGGGGGGGASGGGGDGTGGACRDDLGATGGGGGAGACAGTAGAGGGAGGGSFGIFVANTASPPTLTGNTIYRGNGGNGGNGGVAGAGGVGGAGAAGGLKSTANDSFCTGDGGYGGGGGNGGHGGGGGGSAGGVSYGIYVSGMTGYGAGTNTFPASGGGGSGGGGGPSIGASGTVGAAGASASTN